MTKSKTTRRQKASKKSRRKAATTTSEQPAVQTQIAPILNKLKAEVPGDRAWACTAISNLVLEENNRGRLLESGLLPELLRMIGQEQDQSVVLEALGALRNVLFAGGSLVCDTLLSLDGMAILGALLQKVLSV